MKIINCVKDLAEVIGCNPTMESIKTAIYDSTSCGAWVDEKGGAIRIGSIVEGCQAEVTPIVLPYPFTSNTFWSACDKINEEAIILWDECCVEYCKED